MSNINYKYKDHVEAFFKRKYPEQSSMPECMKIVKEELLYLVNKMSHLSSENFFKALGMMFLSPSADKERLMYMTGELRILMCHLKEKAYIAFVQSIATVKNLIDDPKEYDKQCSDSDTYPHEGMKKKLLEYINEIIMFFKEQKTASTFDSQLSRSLSEGVRSSSIARKDRSHPFTRASRGESSSSVFKDRGDFKRSRP